MPISRSGISDTGPRAAEIQTEIYRRMTPEQRIAQALALCESARTMVDCRDPGSEPRRDRPGAVSNSDGSHAWPGAGAASLRAAVSSPLDVLAIVVEALERAGGRYLVGGSLASSASGEPRQTNDIDLAVELSTADVPDFVAGLGSDFYADSGDIRDAFRRGLSANLVHLPTGLKIDMFPKGPAPFDDSEFQRRRLVNLEGVRSFYLESLRTPSFAS